MFPFMLLMFGVMEMALLYFTATTLEQQVATSSRQIRTGEVQKAGDPLGTFRGLLCDGVVGFIDCVNDVVIDVRSFTNFNTVTYPDFYNSDGQAAGNTFVPGPSGAIVLVRVAYRWNLITPLIGQFISDVGTNGKQLVSSALFRNEPFAPPGP